MAYSLEGTLPMVRYGILMRKHKRLSPQAAALLERIRADIPRHPRTMHLFEENKGEGA